MFSQSLVITSLSIKADIFSRRLSHLCISRSCEVFCREVTLGGKRFAWDLFIPTSSSDQQLLRLFCAREQNREAVSALPVPPPVLARGCPACNKWLHRFPQNSPPDFPWLPYLISPSDLLVTRLKDSNWWNKVSKSPITKAAHSSASLTAPHRGNNYQGRHWSQGDYNSQLRSTIVDVCVRIPKYTL